jgi:hypothetical protein
MWRRLKRLLLVTAALCALLAGLGKLALASDFAARRAVARIGAAVGAPVRAGEVQLGYWASALRGLEVLETLTTPQPPPWTAVGAVEADLSLLQLLRGDLADGAVTLRDVHVTLRFDRDGRLLTGLPVPPAPPAALPLVRLDGGTFTICREGVPDEVFHNIRLELRGDGDKLTLSGTVDDPDWGPWTVAGGRDAADGPFTLALRTAAEVHATPALLRRAPFVPPVTWREVDLEGDTDCALTLRFEPNGRVRYQADLHPHDTRVTVRAIDLTAAPARGRVLVEDGVVTLEDVRGQAAGGDVKVGSVMDFRSAASVLRFTVEAGQVALRRLPEAWRVPRLDGQVSGRADLELTIRGGRTTTRGHGEGTVKAFPLLRPIRLILDSDGTGFRFSLGRG